MADEGNTGNQGAPADTGNGGEGVPDAGTQKEVSFTKEQQACIGIPEGTVPEGWFITVKVTDPEVFAKVKDGTFKMFSIQGNAKRVKL